MNRTAVLTKKILEILRIGETMVFTEENRSKKRDRGRVSGTPFHTQ